MEPSTKAYHLEFRLTGTLEFRDDHWAAHSDQFKITTYGATGDEAELRLHKAVDLLIDELMAIGGLDAVRSRLTASGVHHLIEPADDPPRTRRFERVERKQLATL